LKKEFSDKLNLIILILLTIQISSVSISIAVSSIAFGSWIALWLIQFLINRQSAINTDIFKEIKLINYFILAYAFFEILSRFFAVYPEGAFSNIKRLLLFLIFYVSIAKIINFKALIYILLINISAVSVISIVEIVKYAFKFIGMAGEMPFSEIRIDFFNYPLTSAEIKMISLLSLLPLVFSEYIRDKFIIKKSLLILIIIPVIVSMLLTQSRNVMLATAFCLMIYGIFINRKFLIGFIAAVILAALLLPSSFTERTKSIFDPEHPSNKSRIDMWKVGIEMFKDHPFTGIADSHIKEVYETYKTPEAHGEGVHLHNNFIMILATTGIFGFIAWMGMFILIFIKQIRYFKEEEDLIRKMHLFGSILVMISFQISGIFEWSFGDHEVMTVFFFLIAVPFIIKALPADDTIS